MQSQRSLLVRKLLHDYKVEIILGNYAFKNDIKLSRLKIRSYFLSLNSDYSCINAENAFNGIFHLAYIVKQIGLIVEYELPFECIFEDNNCHFLFMQKRIPLKVAKRNRTVFVQFMSFLHYNILSLCNSQQMTITLEDVPYAFYVLLKCTERKEFGHTKGINLPISFNSVKNKLAAEFDRNPPAF